jgi:hypothetical protein
VRNDTLSDANGRVSFAHLAAGKHLFRIRTNGGGAMALGGGRGAARRASAKAILRKPKVGPRPT